MRKTTPSSVCLRLGLAVLAYLILTGVCLADIQVVSLNHLITDAEYSRALDKIITVSSSPGNRLRVEGAGFVNLAAVPTCVSVSPDGLYAAVGHDRLVSYVDLKTKTVQMTFPISRRVYDLVLAGNGYVYVIGTNYPDVPGEQMRIHCIDLQTGSKTLSTGSDPFITGKSRMKLDPGGNAIYLATDSSSITKYDIGQGTAKFLHGYKYDVKQSLWISENGERIFGGSGQVFTSSDIPAQDIIADGKLDGVTELVHLDSSAVAGKIAAIPVSYDGFNGSVLNTIRIYDLGSLSSIATVWMPKLWGTTDQEPLFVFFNTKGDTLYAILKPTEDTLPFSTMATIRITDWKTHDIQTLPINGGTIIPGALNRVLHGDTPFYKITPDPGFFLHNTLVDGVPIGKKTSYEFPPVTADHTIRAVFGRKPIDYFGLDSGNSFKVTVTSGGISSQLSSKVAALKQPPNMCTVDTIGSGSGSTSWYTKLPDGLGLAGQRSWTNQATTKVSFSTPLLYMKSNVATGNSWASESVGTAVVWSGVAGKLVYNGPASARLEATVRSKVNAVTPAGVFQSYRIDYKMTLTGPITETRSWTEWFAPYFGSVRGVESGSAGSLNSFGICGGEITTPTPIITSVSKTGPNELTIDGYNFGARKPTSTVYVGGKKAPRFSLWSNKQIKCTLPSGPANGEVMVCTGFWNSNSYIAAF